MSEAASDLIHDNLAIVDLAVKYGYNSREAFSRAFQKVYGMSPSQMRQDKSFYSVRAPLSFENIYRQYMRKKQGLTPKIEWRQTLTLYGKTYTVGDNSHQNIPVLWSAFLPQAIEQRFISMGVCLFTDDLFEYFIGDQVNTHNEDQTLTLPGAYYAVFRVEEPLVENVQKTWDHIYATWLSQTTYERRFMYDIEAYCFDEHGSYADLCIPIRYTPKQK